MLKIISIIIMLFMFSNLAFAETQEWIDKKYDFTKAKKIFLLYQVEPSLLNGITEKESLEIVEDKLFKKLDNKLKPKGYNIIIREKFELNTDENNLEVTSNDKSLKDNIDLMVKIELLDYRVGSSYKEGYSYSVPITTYETVYTPNGAVTVPVTKNQIHNVQGGYFPTVFVKVRFDLIDVNNNEIIWSRIDNRSRTNSDEFDNSKTKDVFSRIIKSFSNDLLKKVETEKELEDWLKIKSYTLALN